MKIITRDARTNRRIAYDVREIRPSRHTALDSRVRGACDDDSDKINEFVEKLIDEGISAEDIIEAVKAFEKKSEEHEEPEEPEEPEESEESEVKLEEADEDLEPEEGETEVEEIKEFDDSLKSVGSLSRNNRSIDDSIGEIEEDQAWAKRLNGGK